MKLLTAKEAAEMLRVKPEWVYKKARAGVIPSLRLGRQLRIDEEALGEWIARRTSAAANSGSTPGRTK